MSNDPLPLPDTSAAPPNDAEYQAVYAEIAATDRGRSFLLEYASRNRHPDTHKLIGTIARLEAAMRDDPRPYASATLVHSLADLVAAIEQIEAVLATNGNPASDANFAAERIQDIVMALRQREVEAALCDTLEAAIREIGDAVVRNDAAAARALSATALLRDLARRVNGMIASIGSTGAGATLSPVEDAPGKDATPNMQDVPRQTDAANIESAQSDRYQTPSSYDAEQLDDTAKESGTDGGNLNSHEANDIGLGASVPDMQATAGPEEDPTELFDPRPPIPSPLDGRRDVPRASDSMSETASRAVPVGTSPPSVDLSSAGRDVARATSNDPLAALRALSEEELIALFS